MSALVSARRDAEEDTANERARRLEVSLREERSRLEALRYQLNPHFLFNSLNSIYSTLPVTDAEVPRNMISQLSGYLRSTLSTREEEFTPLREELRSVKQYLAIEEIRFGDDLRVSVEADERALAESIPPFLLQPLVENAIVHGFAATRGVFYIAIRAKVDDTHLHIEVCNTGTWKEPVSEGVGMGNTRRRLALIFGAHASLKVAEEDGWVKIRLELPVKRKRRHPMRCLIVDDEQPARAGMRDMLLQHDSVQVVGEASSVESALRVMEQRSPDLVFLDVQLRGETGFDFIERAPRPLPEIIFVTAYESFAVDAFRVNAVDYLLKPVDPAHLADALARVANRGRQQVRTKEIAHPAMLQSLGLTAREAEVLSGSRTGSRMPRLRAS